MQPVGYGTVPGLVLCGLASTSGGLRHHDKPRYGSMTASSISTHGLHMCTPG